MFNETPHGKISKILNPLSAIMLSPGSKRESTPDFRVISLSETFPDQSFETNMIAPLGDTPIRLFQVLWCLYSDHVCDCATMEEGTSVKISVQSSIILVEEYIPNSLGINCCVFCFDGNGNSKGSSLARKFINVVKIFEALALEIQNLSYARKKTTFNLIKTKTNSYKRDSFLLQHGLETFSFG